MALWVTQQDSQVIAWLKLQVKSDICYLIVLEYVKNMK